MPVIHEDNPLVVGGFHDQRDWEWLDAIGYIVRNYEWPSKEDLTIADGVIDRVGMLPPEYFGSMKSLRDIGTCGVLRTAALAKPLLNFEDERTNAFLTDNSEAQLLTTMGMKARTCLGGYAGVVWGRHEVAMAKKDIRWMNAIWRICSKAVIYKQNLWEVPEGSVEVATEGHTLCSSTGDLTEYEEGVAKFYKQLTPGGVAIRLFMIGSTGYRVGDNFYPAININPDDVEQEARRMGMQVIGGAFGVGASPHAHGTARDEDDPTTYAGFGGAVLLKPRRSVVVVS